MPRKTTPIRRLFDEAWEHRFEPGTPRYMQVSRGSCVLHLSGHHGDADPFGNRLTFTNAISARK